MKQGFLPDTISSDWTDAGRTDQVFDFPNVLSKFLLLGLPLGRSSRWATVNAARAMRRSRTWARCASARTADVAVFELREGEFEFVDNDNTKRTGKQKLFTTAAIVGGKKA